MANDGSWSTREALNPRAFGVPAVGGCLLTDDRPGLATAFVPGREVVRHRHGEALVAAVARLKADPERREPIAAAKRARALRDHP